MDVFQKNRTFCIMFYCLIKPTTQFFESLFFCFKHTFLGFDLTVQREHSTLHFTLAGRRDAPQDLKQMCPAQNAFAPKYPLSINECLFISRANLFSHLGSSSSTVNQSFDSKTNPLSSHHRATLRAIQFSWTRGSQPARDFTRCVRVEKTAFL